MYLLFPLLGARKRPLSAKTVAHPRVILFQLTRQNNLPVLFVRNSFTCIKKTLVGGTPNCTLYASIASALIAASRIAIFLSLTSTAITDSSGVLESTGHLGAVTKTAPPPLVEPAKISLLESGTFKNAHFVFQNGQWIKAGMLDHPTIKMYVFMDNSWCRIKHAFSGPL